MAAERIGVVGTLVVHVSAASFYEISLEVRSGRWSQMLPLVDALAAQLATDHGQAATADG